MGMLSVRIGEEADALKKRFRVWSGSECVKLGSGRRSGVPALVVLDGKSGEELAFLPAESQGAKSLQKWPLENAVAPGGFGAFLCAVRCKKIRHRWPGLSTGAGWRS